MELYSVSISSWRRFAEPATLQVNGKLIALVGPNEAGKSSLLAALESLDEKRPIVPSDATRGKALGEVALKGYYHLNADDLSAAQLKGAYRIILEVSPERDTEFELQPAPPLRDYKPRLSTLGKLKAGLENARFKVAVTDDDQNDNLEEIAELLSSGADTYEAAELSQMEEAAKYLKKKSADFPVRFRKLGGDMQQLVESERSPSPSDLAYNAIGGRFPPILMFGSEDRNLQQEYTLEELSSVIPKALRNLADVAELPLDELIIAMRGGDIAEVETFKTRANRTLAEKFKETWSQSGVSVSFAMKDQGINVVIRNENDRFTSLAERSDGFRQFVALQSFILAKRVEFPILLIDEAEQHLHYDAQADLMQMLAKQMVAQKVIFTTHSAGCLPEDLGNGVRFVNPVTEEGEGDPRSTIINRFWGSDEPGFKSLLMGMGATTLAFFPTRKAVIVEGPSEMLLLPTLLREALNAEALQFQVVPGLSMADKAILPIAGTPATGVCYLVDGDDGGRKLEKEIKKHLKDAKVFRLQVKGCESCELEDLIDDARLFDAADLILAKFNPAAPKLARYPLAGGKFDALAKAFKASAKKPLVKVDLAYELLNLIAENPGTRLLSRAGNATLTKLGGGLVDFFKGIPVTQDQSAPPESAGG